tara:strand:- start:156 stop:2108 length:1953 start_codon:yes stop_codon:yes gene_type:complete
MSAIIEVKFFNSFWAKQVQGSGSYNNPKWPGIEWNPYGYPKFPINAANSSDSNWYVEEARIKGGYNNTIVSLGVRAYLNEKNPVQDIRQSSLIYSGVYNSRTDVNNTNVFSVGETITSDLDPSNGSIQKLFSENTNLIILQENKASYSLINKNTIYSGTQGAAEGSKIPVIGQNVPFKGKFGIGKNPESFAQFGFRKYFADPVRGSVLRLSMDGLTEISDYGMKDYFRDSLQIINNNYNAENIPWTLADSPFKSIVSGISIPLSDIDTNSASNFGNGAVNNMPALVGGALFDINISSGAIADLTTTSVGGSGYSVGDTVVILGNDSVPGFRGEISFILRAAMLSTYTGPQNPFYVEGVNICDVFLGSKVLNSVGGSPVDTGSIITKISTVAGQTPIMLEVSTNNTITPESSGFFAYEYKSKIVGGWDNHNRYYTLSLQTKPAWVARASEFTTLSYDEGIRGWVSRYGYKPGFIFSLKGNYFSTYDNSLYEHYVSNSSRTNFLNYYGVAQSCFVNFIVNSNPSTKKNFQTINYEGDNGWEISSMISDSTKFNNQGQGFTDNSTVIRSYNEGLYIDPNSGFPQRAGFDRKENLYVANIINKSSAAEGEIIPGSLLTGIKGYLANVQMSVDTSTNVGGAKEIWSVGTTFVQSS